MVTKMRFWATLIPVRQQGEGANRSDIYSRKLVGCRQLHGLLVNLYLVHGFVSGYTRANFVPR
jgi:hypothetical protein